MTNQIIPGASYLVYEGCPTQNSHLAHIPGGVPGSSKTVTFYTADGDPIETQEHEFRFPMMDAMLDPNAPKPKPTSFTRIWWPAFELGGGMTKGVPGYAILFHDKNGHRFDWVRIKLADDDLSGITKVDLSSAIEEPADFSMKENKVERTGCIIC